MNPAALTAFRTTYHLDPSVRIVGPWSGKLAALQLFNSVRVLLQYLVWENNPRR